MLTEKSYLNDTYQFEGQCKIICADTDSSGHYVILDKTIFYPQGGGQPSDQGIIKNSDTSLNVRSVKQVGPEIRHYVNQDASAFVNQSFTSRLDRDLRLLHAKLHTAGHLISHVVENFYPSAKNLKGHHFPGESYVEFKSSRQIAPEDLQNYINRAIEKGSLIEASYSPKEQIIQDFPQMATFFEGFNEVRVLKVGDYPSAPCGGTHVKNTSELAGLSIDSIKCKNGVVKVKYSIH